MPLLKELGTAVRRRRLEIGLSQERLADLVDLSRATINELETGKLNDLSSKRIERIANELGFSVGLVGARGRRGDSAVAAAARIASVPYGTQLPPALLLESLRDGAVPPAYIPHLRTLLDEAPVAILAAVAEELERDQGVPARDSWQRMRMLASVLKCNRRLWASMPT